MTFSWAPWAVRVTPDGVDMSFPGSEWFPGSGSPGSGTVSIATCTGNRCTVTLGGPGATVHVLGESIALDGVRSGRATVRIGGRSVSVGEGDTVNSGRLGLRCTSVTADTVSLSGARR